MQHQREYFNLGIINSADVRSNMCAKMFEGIMILKPLYYERDKLRWLANLAM